MKNSIKIFLVPCVFFVLFSCGGGDGSDTPSDICEDGYELIDGACNLTGTLVDTDADTISDSLDNCPLNWNPSQSTSGDTDSIADACDNCMYDTNQDQSDIDGDGIGDACEDDTDGDGIVDSIDNCDTVINADQANADGDSCGDSCDDNDADADICSDSDGDLIEDLSDNCASHANPDQCDTDHDGIGNDTCDTDDDGDGTADTADSLPYNPSPTCIADTDGDGVCDDFDNCDSVANICQKTEEACDGTADADGDGYTSDVDCNDNNPNIHPGATETCNGQDDDCDGDVDDADALEFTTWYVDADRDGYGSNSDSGTSFCEDPNDRDVNFNSTPTPLTNPPVLTPGSTKLTTVNPITHYADNNDDCDDSNANVNPGETEVANDGIDNDCEDGDQVTETEDVPVTYTAAALFRGFHYNSTEHGYRTFLFDVTTDSYANDVLSFHTDTNVVPNDDSATYDYKVWYTGVRGDQANIGFIEGTISGTSSDGHPATNSVAVDMPKGDFDWYAIILRGFKLKYTDDITDDIENMSVRIKWSAKTHPADDFENVISSTNDNLQAKYWVSYDGDDWNKFNYEIYYTIIGINEGEALNYMGETRHHCDQIGFYAEMDSNRASCDMPVGNWSQTLDSQTRLFGGFVEIDVDCDDNDRCDSGEPIKIETYLDDPTYDSGTEEVTVTMHASANFDKNDKHPFISTHSLVIGRSDISVDTEAVSGDNAPISSLTETEGSCSGSSWQCTQ